MGKNIFWNLNNLPHLFGLWSKNAQSENFFTSCHNCNPRVQRHFLIKSNFSKKSYICSSVLEFEQFFLSFDIKKSGCQTNNLLIQKKEWRKEFVEKSFFKSSSNFQQKRLSNKTKNTRRIVKTTFNVFRRTVLGCFSGLKELPSSFLVVERNYWTFGVNFLKIFQNCSQRVQRKVLRFFLVRRVIVWSFSVSERK